MLGLGWKKRIISDNTLLIKDHSRIPREIRKRIIDLTNDVFEEVFSKKENDIKTYNKKEDRSENKPVYIRLDSSYSAKNTQELINKHKPSSIPAGYFDTRELEKSKKLQIIINISLLVSIAIIRLKKENNITPDFLETDEFGKEFKLVLENTLEHELKHLKHSLENPAIFENPIHRLIQKEHRTSFSKTDEEKNYVHLHHELDVYFGKLIKEGVAHYYNQRTKIIRNDWIGFYLSLKGDVEEINTAILNNDPLDSLKKFHEFRMKMDKLLPHLYSTVQLTHDPEKLSRKKFYEVYEENCKKRFNTQPLLSYLSGKGILDFRTISRNLKKRGKELRKLRH